MLVRVRGLPTSIRVHVLCQTLVRIVSESTDDAVPWIANEDQEQKREKDKNSRRDSPFLPSLLIGYETNWTRGRGIFSECCCILRYLSHFFWGNHDNGQEEQRSVAFVFKFSENRTANSTGGSFEDEKKVSDTPDFAWAPVPVVTPRRPSAKTLNRRKREPATEFSKRNPASGLTSKQARQLQVSDEDGASASFPE